MSVEFPHAAIVPNLVMMIANVTQIQHQLHTKALQEVGQHSHPTGDNKEQMASQHPQQVVLLQGGVLVLTMITDLPRRQTI